jgi:hypothetical protein
MSELNENVWAVISKRGVEATGVSYEAALALRRALDSAKVYGLCIVTIHAAERELEILNRKKLSDAKG